MCFWAAAWEKRTKGMEVFFTRFILGHQRRRRYVWSYFHCFLSICALHARAMEAFGQSRPIYETIYAFATAPGKSGVAVLRISGSQSLAILQYLSPNTPAPAPRQAVLRQLFNPSAQEMIDQALCLYFAAPHSFTGEDVVELHLHGSRAVRAALLEVLGDRADIRMAAPGEFARRAFLNGKMDLTESEGLADLIEAETHIQLQQATRQMRGTHKAYFEGLRGQAIQALALLEAYIDFPDEEIPESVMQQVEVSVAQLAGAVSALLADAKIGERIRDGVEVVLIGAPNAGKSSLLNYLAGRDVAIVHDTPGTTRDMVEVAMDLAGYPVTLVDTAGLREAENAVEQEGIRRARARAEQADLTLQLVDVTNAESLSKIIAKIDESTPSDVIQVFTKTDLAPTLDLPSDALAISVKTGRGMAVFLDQLTKAVAMRMQTHTPPMITRARHREHLQKASMALAQFNMALPLELACEELRHVAFHIGNITGKIHTDDLLDVIFKEFCIGK